MRNHFPNNVFEPRSARVVWVTDEKAPGLIESDDAHVAWLCWLPRGASESSASGWHRGDRKAAANIQRSVKSPCLRRRTADSYSASTRASWGQVGKGTWYLYVLVCRYKSMEIRKLNMLKLANVHLHFWAFQSSRTQSCHHATGGLSNLCSYHQDQIPHWLSTTKPGAQRACDKTYEPEWPPSFPITFPILHNFRVTFSLCDT